MGNQCEKEVTVKNLIGRFVREEDGQDIIEYALLAAFVSIVAATIIKTIGVDVTTIYENIKVQTGLAAAASGGGS
jgi:Flp pilus assembly pilin Flp